MTDDALTANADLAEIARLRAELDALRDASTDLINQLTLLTRDDMTYLWRIGGRPLDDAFMALKRQLRHQS